MPTQIQPFTRTPSRHKPATFSEDMDERLKEENSRIEQMNTQSAENNATALAVQKDKESTAQYATSSANSASLSLTAKDEAIDARNEAVLAKNEIKGYVIPTEATYSPQTIQAKIAMDAILTTTGAR